MQADTILGLHHAHGDLEQLQDDGRRLGIGQLGMDQDFGAQGVMQDIGGAGEKQAHVVGQEGMVGSTVAGVGVIAVLVSTGDLEDTLGEKIALRMFDIGGMALVRKRLGQTLGQSNLAINTTQNHGAKVRGYRTAVEIAAHREAGDGRKTQLLWSRLGYGRPRLASSEALLA